MTTRILIADDHDLIRAGLRSVLEAHAQFQVVAEAATGTEAVELAALHRPDLVIMDVSMPGLDGIEATGRILAAQPTTRVLALSMHESRDYLSRMLRAGASGYMLKIYAAREILAAIHTVLEGRTYLSPSMIGGMVRTLLTEGDGAERAAAGPALTSRQVEVLRLIVSGKSLKEIAYQLRLSVKTLEKHRSHVMAKLGAGSSAELAMVAIRLGLVDPWNHP
jgi:DNA-binding NarL/FixJ family response regulator